MEKTSGFRHFKLIDSLFRAIDEVGYEKPTPIQEQAIPLILEGHDLLGIAQTGTGKTAAFAIPILSRLAARPGRALAKSPRCLILTPTRELAIQIHQNLQTYGKYLPLRHGVIFGGVGQGNQVRDLQHGVDVLVATPGRLLDLVGQRHLRLDMVEIFVLDEADRMLDMGFMKDIQKILPLLPNPRHNLFFSATMPKDILALAQKILVNPRRVEISPPSTTVERIQQSVMFVEKKDKMDLLVHLLKRSGWQKTLVFVEMKHVANKVSEKLLKNGIQSAAIHGNKSQGARQRAIQDFTNDKVEVLVATDIASRGIDIDGITHVINFELSNVAENYVHRIGRTARAGADGAAISLVTAEEKALLTNIERSTRQKIEINREQPYHSESAAKSSLPAPVIARGQFGKKRPRPTGRRFGQRTAEARGPR